MSKKGKGCPKKYAMPLKTKDTDTTLSYGSSSDCDEYKDGETSNSFQCDVQEISKKSEKSISFQCDAHGTPKQVSLGRP